MTQYELQIQVAIMRDCLGRLHHKAAVTNSQYLLVGEADLISVTKAGLVHEFEIKCSRGDYNREFKQKVWKHHTLARSHMLRCPNYFWFVTRDFEIEPPDYAGWILADTKNNGQGRDLVLREQKPAPRLHTGKWGDDKVAKMARLLSFRLLKQYDGRLHGG